MDTQTLLHWIYVASMAAGALLFLAWSRQPRGVPQYEYLIAIFIPIWSGLAYTAMALGQGKIEIAGQITHYARYLDWVVSTPLLLLSLGFTAMFYIPVDQRRVTLLAAIVGADIIMILTGLFADLSREQNIRFLWYGIGCVAFMAVLWMLWVPLRQIARSQGPELASGYDKLTLFLIVLWFGYPTIWILGPSGLGVFDQTVETLLFVVLPFFSKVGFSFADLVFLRGLKKTAEHRELSSI